MCNEARPRCKNRCKSIKGGMPEWFNGAAWKAVTLTSPVGSNPTPTANFENSDFGRFLPRPRYARARQKPRFYTDF